MALSSPDDDGLSAGQDELVWKLVAVFASIAWSASDAHSTHVFSTVKRGPLSVECSRAQAVVLQYAYESRLLDVVDKAHSPDWHGHRRIMILCVAQRDWQAFRRDIWIEKVQNEHIRPTPADIAYWLGGYRHWRSRVRYA